MRPRYVINMLVAYDCCKRSDTDNRYERCQSNVSVGSFHAAFTSTVIRRLSSVNRHSRMGRRPSPVAYTYTTRIPHMGRPLWYPGRMPGEGVRSITVAEGVHSELTELQSQMTNPGYRRVSISDVIQSLLTAHREAVAGTSNPFADIDTR